jgi:hypothetical protein
MSKNKVIFKVFRELVGTNRKKPVEFVEELGEKY